ncbi:MAG: hypothetical protein NW206_19995 [Hyphomonadaceae bacterium]|nr:hypothetical protein [Hyphomonadaceae bacterium]
MKTLKRMTGAELRKERDDRELTQEDFGVFVAKLLGRERAYTRFEVSAWEIEDRPVPEAVERALLRLRLNELAAAS